MLMPIRRNAYQDWVPTIFNDFFNNDWALKENSNAPAINVIEDSKSYIVEVAAPGMKKEDFKLHIDDDNDLIISMEKENKKEDKKPEKDSKEGKSCSESRYLRREFSYSKYQQTFGLPDNVDVQKIGAHMNDGVLRIELPKKEIKENPGLQKQIEIL